MSDLTDNRDNGYEKKDVSIIIVNYNTKGLLRNCINSIYEHTQGLSFEIIVVDNASSDGSIDMLRRDFPDVVTVEAGGNLGFGRANNLGMSIASGKYLFLLNSDTLFLNNALKKIYDHAEDLSIKGYRLGVLGTILLDRNHDTCHSYGKFITATSELKDLASKYLRFLKDKYSTNPPKIKGTLEVDYVTGADMFIPSEIFRLTGGFDPDFFMYCEEVDWQKRMAEAGYSRIIVDGPEIVHLEGGSEPGESRLWSFNRLINIYTSKKIYRKKHYRKAILPFFRILYFILDLPLVVAISLMTRRKECLRLIKLK